MRQTQFQQIVILSAELTTNTLRENDMATSNLKSCLEDLGYKYSSAIGVYNYRVESSFVVLVNSEADILLLRTLACVQFKQECILYQDRQGESHLHYGDKREHLGKLREINKHQAVKLNGYTLMNNKYYAVA